MRNCKSMLKALLVSMLVVMWMPIMSMAANYYITTTTVNMRAKAGVQYARVLELPYGCVVDVKSTSNKSWYKVVYRNNEQQSFSGYICSAYLKKADVYKTTASLNLRYTPNGSIMKTMPKGSVVVITDTYTGAWYRTVYYDKKGNVYRGYSYQNYLQKKGAKKGTYVATDSVYMHTEPSMDSRSIMVVPKGKKVSVTNITHGKWYYAKYKASNGKTYKGYISNVCLKKK